MYTEEYERKIFPIRNFLLKLMIVLAILFFVVFLLPMLFSSKQEEKAKVSQKDHVFIENLETMKEAGISYFKENKLPDKTNASSTITLKQLIRKNLMTTPVDQNGKSCDVDDSYVKMTKKTDEYEMKVHLKCSKKEDDTILYLGSYDDCKDVICEKEDVRSSEHEEETASKVSENNVSEQSTDSLPTPTDHQATSSSEKQQPKDETVVKVPQTVMEYEYKKTTDAVMSPWSSWSTWAKNVNGYQALDCNDQDPTCVKKIQLFSRKEQIGTYQKAYVSSRKEQRKYGSYQELACANYDYIRMDETTYITTKNYDVVTTITPSTQGNVGDWIYQGTYSSFVPPQDTVQTKYIRMSYDFECTGCSTQPKSTYKVYQYQGRLTNVTANSTTTAQLLSSNTVKKVNTSIYVNCSKIVTKTIPVYQTVTTYETSYKDEPYYGTVTYYSQKTRTIKQKGTTVTAWSTSSNDQKLLAKGYYYTGKSRKK